MQAVARKVLRQDAIVAEEVGEVAGARRFPAPAGIHPYNSGARQTGQSRCLRHRGRSGLHRAG